MDGLAVGGLNGVHVADDVNPLKTQLSTETQKTVAFLYMK